jgi:hypothetical protein
MSTERAKRTINIVMAVGDLIDVAWRELTVVYHEQAEEEVFLRKEIDRYCL